MISLLILKVTFLGTSASIPTKKRGQVSIAIQRGKNLLLFDAGEGVQRAIITTKIGFKKNMKIFISHLHGDHCLGLLGLLQTMSLMDRTDSLQIYGPIGLKKFISVNMETLNFRLTFNLDINEVKEGIIYEESEYKIISCYSNHSRKSLSYILEENERPGIFYPEKALKMGIPKGELWSKIQGGEIIKIKNKKINPEEILGPARKGRKIGISGDTRPTNKLVNFFQECDLLIFDSTFADELQDKANETLHSTAREAAKLAKESSVKQLILNHISTRYSKSDILLKEAREEHSNVKVAEDYMIINIPNIDS